VSSATRSAGNPSLHRDLKPSNCIVNQQRGLVLIDISTLRLVDDGFDPVGLHTPQYTAPEALAAPNLSRTAATEAYSLGALAAFCLTGRDPVVSADFQAELVATARRAGVREPQALAAHVMTALDTDPTRRPTDLAGWSRRLGELGRVRRRWPAYAAVAVAVALLLGLYLAVGSPWARDRGLVGQPPASLSPSGSPIVGGASGRITEPADGAEVKQCSYFAGTATVPAGVTLVLAMRNLVNGDPARYVEVVFGWDDPARLSRWRGAQYFGNDDETVGQRYRVELVAVAVDAARAWKNSNDPGTGLVTGGKVLDHVDVRRAAGSVPNACVGP
jgi:hypothetical protein